MSTKLKISLDATEYRNELNKVVSETEAARSQLGSKSSVSAPAAAGNTGTVSVTAEVTGMEKVQELYDKISALPEKKNVVVAVNDQASVPIKNVQNKIKKIPNKKGVAITVPNTSMWGKVSSGIKGCWKEMTSLRGGAKQAVTSMIAGGGLIGIAYAGVQGAIKACTALYDTFIQKGKEAAQAHLDTASSIEKAASNNERLKASSEAAVSQLSQLAGVGKMNNAQTAQAVALVAKLTKQYGDLGVSVDKATGRINGLGSAIVAKQEKDAQREIASLKAQIKSLENANAQEDKNISAAGFRIPFTDIQLGGEQDAKEAGARKAANTDKLMDVRLKLREARKRQADIAKNQLMKTQAENAALEQQQRDRMDQQTYRNADNELNRTKDPVARIANRQRLIAGEQNRNDDLHKKTEAAKAQMAQYAPGAKGADAQKYEDAKKAYLQNAAEQAKSDEKIAAWNEQMAYRVYAKLKEHNALSKYAVVKTLQNLLWDIRVCNASGKWEIEPVTKSARQALEGMGLTLPETVQA